jgi:hypothetical protein
MSSKVTFRFVSAFMLMCGACAKPTASIPAGQAPTKAEGVDTVAKRITDDPVAFLNESLTATRQVPEFTCTFLRQERLGLLKELKPQETILAEYRDQPFSVHFTWQNPDSEYAQAAFVDGKNENKVVILPRKGLLGLPAVPQKFPPQMAVDWGKARNPITDFGPRRMLERVLDGVERAKPYGGAKITLLGPTEMGPAKEPCHHLEIRYPKCEIRTVALQDIYISTKTRLPVGTYLWHEGKAERTDSTLDAMYLYTQLDPNVQLSDANFEIQTSKRGSEKTVSVGAEQ